MKLKTKKVKMKTRKSVSKRFRITATGKVIYRRQGLRHILTKKSSKRKRRLGKPGILKRVDAKRIKRAMPYNA